MTPLRTFRRREDGTLSVEALLWIVACTIVAALFLDSTAIFAARTDIMRVVQDANRAASVGLLKDAAQHQAYIISRLAPVSPSVKVTTTIDADKVLWTEVSVPSADFQVIGMFSALTNIRMGFRAKHIIEDWES